MDYNNKYKKPIRWGIIGCGNVTEIKSGPAYQQTENFEVKAVMRRNVEKLKDYAQRHKIEKYYANANELINDNEIDAVYIATPPDSHKYYALQVAEAGKICCIEKPMTPSYKDSLTIYEVFKNKNIPLFVAYYRRSLPRFNQIKKWLEENEIGVTRHISWQYNRKPTEIDLSGNYNWRTDAKVAPGGYFDDLACHGLDLFTYFFGNVEEAYGVSTNQQGLYTAKDAISACWKYQNGITGAGTWNFGADGFKDRVEIFGSKGKITFSIFHETPLQIEVSGKQRELFIENPKHIQSFHIKNMGKQLFTNNYSHPSNGYTACHTNWIMDEILTN